MVAGWDSTLDDIARLRRDIDHGERAEIEQRVTDPDQHRQAMEHRRRRLRELEQKLTGFEACVHTTGLMLLAALLAGHRLAVFGLVALPLLGNRRTR